jgi:hypothetical protein
MAGGFVSIRTALSDLITVHNGNGQQILAMYPVCGMEGFNLTISHDVVSLLFLWNFTRFSVAFLNPFKCHRINNSSVGQSVSQSVCRCFMHRYSETVVLAVAPP